MQNIIVAAFHTDAQSGEELFKDVLKREVGVCALNSHGNYIVDHRKSWKNHEIVFLNFCGNSDIYLKLSLSDTDSSSNDGKPMYMQIFASHQHWEGSYIYNSSSYYCYLYAHSEHNSRKGVVLATFRDKQGATIELEGVY